MRTIIVVVACLIATTSRADDDADAKRHAAKAHRLFQLGRFAEAAKEYEETYLLHEDSMLMFNIGQCYRQAQQNVDAIRAYRNYLQASPHAANRAEVEGYIRDLEGAAAAPPPPAPPPPAAAPPAVVDEGGVNLIVHGPAFNEDKQKRCNAAVRRLGIMLDPVAQITAVLTLGKVNRLQIVDHDRGVLRDEPRPRWGMEQLCADAAQTAMTALSTRR